MIFLRLKHQTRANRHVAARNTHEHSNHRHNVHLNHYRRHNYLRQQHRPNTISMSPNDLHLSRVPHLTASLSSIDFVRSITINERLASIGGLFGAVSIIITGGLLYAIFTTNSEDKWYYIIAVLINVSLLVLLMVVAILFDRFYLRKLTRNMQGTPQRVETLVFPPQHNIQSTTLAPHSVLNDSNTLGCVYNDVPPVYPGYTHQQTNELNGVSSSSQTSNQTSYVNRSNLPELCINVHSLNQLKRDTSHKTQNEFDSDMGSGKFMPPPDYFDLYPSSHTHTDSNIIIEHMLNISNTGSALTSDSNENNDNESNNNIRILILPVENQRERNTAK